MRENETEQPAESARPETARERFEREEQARRRGLKKYGITSGFWDFLAPPKAAPSVEAQKAAEPEAVTETTEKPGAEWERFERGQVSRRAALKKMGITTGMAVFALFSVDDLARMVGREMERRERDSRVAEQIAREFSEAGIAMAAGPSVCCHNGPNGGSCTCCSGNDNIGACCLGSPNPNQCCVNAGNAQKPQNVYDTCLTCCQIIHASEGTAFDQCAATCPGSPS